MYCYFPFKSRTFYDKNIKTVKTIIGSVECGVIVTVSLSVEIIITNAADNNLTVKIECGSLPPVVVYFKKSTAVLLFC